ncbi:MAG: hypothetical protein ABSF43_14775, partial [Rectinemataceae bacterium]
LRVGDKIYTGVQENISIEAGKRLKFARSLTIGKAKLRVEGIPEGSTILIDDDERPLTRDLAGGMVFDGTIDAGYSKIEVVHANKTWYTSVFPQPNSTQTYKVDIMFVRYALQRYSVKLKGKEEDWAGIEPIFGKASIMYSSNLPSGSQIAGGRICRDEKNLYIRIDFSNGSPGLFNSSDRMLQLYQDSYHFGKVNLELNVSRDGTRRSVIWFYSSKTGSEAGSYAVGPSFIELRFPLSSFSKYFDFSKPIRARLQVQRNDPFVLLDQTSFVDIIIGK